MKHFNFNPFPILKTQRLSLRKLEDNDDQAVFALRSDANNRRFLDVELDQNIEQSRAFIKKINSGVVENKWIYWGISLLNESQLIGTICLWKFSKNNTQAEIGYELNSSFQGFGYMNEALKKIIEFGFDQLKLSSIEAFTNAQNTGSIKLLQKHNFKLITQKANIHSITGLPYHSSIFILQNTILK